MRPAEGPVRPVVAGVPTQMADYLEGPDPAVCARTMEAMLTMSKLDIDGLRRACEGTAAD